MPGRFLPDRLVPRLWFESGFIVRADTLEELAERLGIDQASLVATAERVSGFARTGVDLDFRRGDSLYDQHYGDPTVSPNPCLSPLEKAPFYAMRVDPGDFGTCGGLIVDTKARVLSANGLPISGLYATGNCTAGLLTTYPGPGATLGPAMTFGYVAGRELAMAEGVAMALDALERPNEALESLERYLATEPCLTPRPMKNTASPGKSLPGSPRRSSDRVHPRQRIRRAR